MKKLAIIIGFACALVVSAPNLQLQAQQTSATSTIISGCQACSQQYAFEAGTWIHYFQWNGGGGQDQDSDCDTGPNPDGEGCHQSWWDQACNYRHSMCYPAEFAATTLSMAVKASDAARIELTLSEYKQISRRADDGGYEMTSCDQRYKYVVGKTGDIQVLLSAKRSLAD